MVFFIVWIIGVIVCFEMMFRLFERVHVGFNTTDIYFGLASATLAFIWPVYVPLALVRRFINTRKFKRQ